MQKAEYLTQPDILYFSFVYYYTEIWMEFSPDWEPGEWLSFECVTSNNSDSD